MAASVSGVRDQVLNEIAADMAYPCRRQAWRPRAGAAEGAAREAGGSRRDGHSLVGGRARRRCGSGQAAWRRGP